VRVSVGVGVGMGVDVSVSVGVWVGEGEGEGVGKNVGGLGGGVHGMFMSRDASLSQIVTVTSNSLAARLASLLQLDA